MWEGRGQAGRGITARPLQPIRRRGAPEWARPKGDARPKALPYWRRWLRPRPAPRSSAPPLLADLV